MEKRSLAAKLAIRAALVYCTVAGVCQGIYGQTDIPFQSIQNTLVIISVRIGEAGSFDFLLDTGADTSIIDPAIAGRAMASRGLTAQGDRVRQTTLAGVQNLVRGSIDAVSLGPVQIGHLAVLVQDLSALRKLDPMIEGIAGQNFLSQFNYLIDYREHVVRIEAGTEIGDTLDGERMRVESTANSESTAHRMFIAAEAQSGNRGSLRLLLDSGASAMVLFPEASRRLKLAARSSGTETTSGGKTQLQVGLLHSFTVGSQQFHDVTVALPSAEPAEQVGDGLLPTAFFKLVYVSNREGFVMLNPRVRRN